MNISGGAVFKRIFIDISMNDNFNSVIRQFQEGILAYWTQHGRHHLPWRSTRDPWKLLMAEVLLRKTTSVQAAEVYREIESLSPEDVVKIDDSKLENILKPLGIYKVRAAQLKDIAQALVSTDPEAFLSDSFLRSLPGIGRYISNSIRCCAFGHPVPALDTNMIRIIQRVFGWKSGRKRPREDKKLWAFAETLVPNNQGREFNWGILDFGASVCTYRNPKCPECPLNDICTFYRQQSTVNQGEIDSMREVHHDQQ